MIQVVAFVVGILLLQFQSELPALLWIALLPFILLALRLPRLRLLLCVCLGFLWALINAHGLLDRPLDPLIEGKDVYIEGVITSLPEQQKKRVRFQFEIKKLQYQDESHPSPGKVQLSWYRNASQLRVG